MSSSTGVPAVLAHLLTVAQAPDEILIAETTSLSGQGMRGSRKVTTGLVPTNRLKTVLEGPAGQGWLRTEFSDPPVYRKGRIIHRPSDLVTPSGGVVEALVESWTNHNVLVSMPQTRLTATYGLQPRFIESDQSIRWDDPEHVRYDVVIVRPASKYHGPDDYTRSEVLLRREYAQDYADTRGRAIVAVFYEQQSLSHDAELESLLGPNEFCRIDFPGIGIEIKRSRLREDRPLFVAAWGCRLLLRPGKTFPVSVEEKPKLLWPGFGEVDSSSGFDFVNALDHVFVKDAVLTKFEERSEYRVCPEDGSVSYEGRWALGFSNRIGRNYIAYELRKLYEGCPRAVIEHVHKFVVERAEAEDQRAKLGNANIGNRSARYMAEFVGLQRELHDLSIALELTIDPSAIAQPTADELEYKGWWTFDGVKAIGHVAPDEMSRKRFLERCADLHHPLESVRQKPLRHMLVRIGVPAGEIDALGSLKLLGRIGQLALTGVRAGIQLRRDADVVVAQSEASALIPELRPLFALNDLRQLASHAPGAQADAKLKAALAVFGIDVATVKGGWGRVLDEVYDGVTDALAYLAQAIRAARHV